LEERDNRQSQPVSVVVGAAELLSSSLIIILLIIILLLWPGVEVEQCPLVVSMTLLIHLMLLD
jgi:hypothetical protein